jgi:ABC-type antimicrobial peptide transport system permease subunit
LIGPELRRERLVDDGHAWTRRRVAIVERPSVVISALAVLCLILASIGLYAVIAFLFARRTQEIGVRIAVGASQGQVVRMVLPLCSWCRG